MWDGTDGCAHEWGGEKQAHANGHEGWEWDPERVGKGHAGHGGKPMESSTVSQGAFCRLCGAWRGAHGLEPTPELFVAHEVAIWREARRVLRADGTAWVNLGDSYASMPPGNKATGVEKWKTSGLHGAVSEIYAKTLDASVSTRISTLAPGLKPKDLVGIPWRVASALQADGWYLRSDIIWHKPNPMPESVTDRPTKAHEYLFLFAKGQWKTSIVQFSNLPGERFHFLKDFGLRPSESPFSLTLSSGNHSSLVELCVRLASSIFDCSQLQKDFTLPPFYSEVWQQCLDGSDSDFVCSLPVMHRASVFSARFLTAKATAKEFLCEIQRLKVTLADGNKLLIGGLPIELLNTPSFYRDGEGAVTVHHAGEICKVDFVHDQIVVQKPTNCKYFYDAEAVREAGVEPDREREDRIGGANGHTVRHSPGAIMGASATRNRRSVWTVATAPYKDCHFATFPPALIKPCILAGCPEHVCPKCGAPWVREVETHRNGRDWNANNRKGGNRLAVGQSASDGMPDDYQPPTYGPEHPTCACDLPAIGGTTMDIFGGSGTTAAVALEYGRRAILIERKPEYVDLQRKRLQPVAGRPLLAFGGGIS